MSVIHKPPVTGFKPTLKVKKYDYTDQLKPKKLDKPFSKLGYN